MRMWVSRRQFAKFTSATLLTLAIALPSFAQITPTSPEERARATEAQMTDDERFGMIHGLMVFVLKLTGGSVSQEREKRVPASIPQTAGWAKGVPRLGVPDLVETDATLGIGNPLGGRKGDTTTALPSGQALGATFNP